jgi:hypothetical protein
MYLFKQLFKHSKGGTLKSTVQLIITNHYVPVVFLKTLKPFVHIDVAVIIVHVI